MEWISSDEFSLEAKASAALVVANMARNGILTSIILSSLRAF